MSFPVLLHLLQDIVISDAAVAQLSAEGDRLVLASTALQRFVAVAAETYAAAATAGALQPDAVAARRAAGTRAVAAAAGTSDGPAGADCCSLLADFAAGVTDTQRAMQRLQAGAGVGGGYGGLLGAPPPPLASPSGASTSVAGLAERSRLCEQLHRLLYAEAVLGALFQRCEELADGLEATAQVLRFMARGLDEVSGSRGGGPGLGGGKACYLEMA
jgi:hypothetical protein